MVNNYLKAEVIMGKLLSIFGVVFILECIRDSDQFRMMGKPNKIQCINTLMSRSKYD